VVARDHCDEEAVHLIQEPADTALVLQGEARMQEGSRAAAHRMALSPAAHLEQKERLRGTQDEDERERRKLDKIDSDHCKERVTRR